MIEIGEKRTHTHCEPFCHLPLEVTVMGTTLGTTNLSTHFNLHCSAVLAKAHTCVHSNLDEYLTH